MFFGYMCFKTKGLFSHIGMSLLAPFIYFLQEWEHDYFYASTFDGVWLTLHLQGSIVGYEEK